MSLTREFKETVRERRASIQQGSLDDGPRRHRYPDAVRPRKGIAHLPRGPTESQGPSQAVPLSTSTRSVPVAGTWMGTGRHRNSHSRPQNKLPTVIVNAVVPPAGTVRAGHRRKS